MADGDPSYALTSDGQGPSEAHQWLSNFWPKTMNEIKATKQVRLTFSLLRSFIFVSLMLHRSNLCYYFYHLCHGCQHLCY